MSEISLKLRLLKQYIERNNWNNCPAYTIDKSLRCTNCPLYNKDASAPRSACILTSVDDNVRIALAKDMFKAEMMELITNEC